MITRVTPLLHLYGTSVHLSLTPEPAQRVGGEQRMFQVGHAYKVIRRRVTKVKGRYQCKTAFNTKCASRTGLWLNPSITSDLTMRRLARIGRSQTSKPRMLGYLASDSNLSRSLPCLSGHLPIYAESSTEYVTSFHLLPCTSWTSLGRDDSFIPVILLPL